MNPLTLKTETGKTLLLVELPIDAKGINIFMCGFNKSVLQYVTEVEPTYWQSKTIDINLPNDNLTLLGTIHAEGKQIVFSEGFDPEPLVEKKDQEGYTADGPTYWEIFRNYQESEEYWKLGCDQCSNPKDSFISLIQKETGKTFFNPLGVPEREDCICRNEGEAENCKYKCFTFYDDEAWRAAESKVFKGKVAVIEVKK